jgi:predicted DCC family thiol-disulfide oxidoreductase YuxK
MIMRELLTDPHRTMTEINPQTSTVEDSDVVLLFDGVCNLCNGWVNFVIDREVEPVVRFASLQSSYGHGLLTSRGLPGDYLGSLVLVVGDQTYANSAAVLRMTRYLSIPWRWLWVFLLIPAFIRDPFYRYVAKRRYRWFGKQDACRVPTPELRDRFLD